MRNTNMARVMTETEIDNHREYEIAYGRNATNRQMRTILDNGLRRIGRQQPAAAAARGLTPSAAGASMRAYLTRLRVGIGNVTNHAATRITNSARRTVRGIRHTARDIQRRFGYGDAIQRFNPRPRPLSRRVGRFLKKNKRKIIFGTTVATLGGTLLGGGIAEAVIKSNKQDKSGEGFVNGSEMFQSSTGTLGQIVKGATPGGGGGGGEWISRGGVLPPKVNKRRRRNKKATGKKAKAAKKTKHVKRIGGKRKKVGRKKGINKRSKTSRKKKHFAAF